MSKLMIAFAIAVLLAGCSEDGPDDTGTTTVSSSTTSTSVTTTVARDDTGASASSTTEAPTPSVIPAPSTTAATPTSTVAATTTTMRAGQGPLEPQDGVYRIRWGQLAVTPGFTYDESDPDNPFYLIHTDAERDGFSFSLELYTTGYGQLWEGETGTVDIACTEPPPGPDSTGVCPHFDPDGPGPVPDIIGFTATGSITVTRLDEQRYDISIDELTLPFGIQVQPFRMRGTATE